MLSTFRGSVLKSQQHVTTLTGFKSSSLHKVGASIDVTGLMMPGKNLTKKTVIVSSMFLSALTLQAAPSTVPTILVSSTNVVGMVVIIAVLLGFVVLKKAKVIKNWVRALLMAGSLMVLTNTGTAQLQNNEFTTTNNHPAPAAMSEVVSTNAANINGQYQLLSAPMATGPVFKIGTDLGQELKNVPTNLAVNPIVQNSNVEASSALHDANDNRQTLPYLIGLNLSLLTLLGLSYLLTDKDGKYIKPGKIILSTSI